MSNVSVSGLVWEAKTYEERTVLAIMQSHDLPELMARILAARGLDTSHVNRFLQPTLREALVDPLLLKDMDKAVARLVQAIMHQEKLVIFGDYDVDGATSSALLARFFTAVGFSNYSIYIPDRLREGYGPNTKAFEGFATEGARVIVTVDCGTLAFAPLARAREIGLDVVVLDHHLSNAELPEACAIVNPNRLDETFPIRNIAAVGVTYLTLIALKTTLRTAGWFQDRAEPDLLQWLDLVALGTVCDVMTLTGLNRAFVAQGLKIMARRQNPGIVALIDTARLDDMPSAYHLGFVLGPRINAGGRVGEASLGATLLTSSKPAEIQRIAEHLHHLNEERKAIEMQVLEEAILQAESLPTTDPVLVVAGAGWHPGVVGIVASRLKDKFHRPVAVIAVAEGIGKASARSVTGIDLGALVVDAYQAGILLNGGGHTMAAGFTVEAKRIADLTTYFSQRLAARTDLAKTARSRRFDAYLTLAAATPEMVETLEQLGPFGSGNHEPIFAISDVQIMRPEWIGGGGLRCFIRQPSGTSLRAVAFRVKDTPLGSALLESRKPLTLIVKLSLNRWQERNQVDVIIQDAIIPEILA
jgi:single-stranded-DNA-specific exonuclease